MSPGELFELQPAVDVVTWSDVAGAIGRVSRRELDPGDECSECGASLARRPGGTLWAWMSDCGRYCSKRCAREHAEFLAAEMTRRRREDAKRA